MELLNKALNAILKTNLEDLKVYDLEQKNPFFDIVIVATGTQRQIDAVIGYLKQEMKNVFQIKGIEGQKTGWILIDLGEVIIHLFDEENRQLYKFDDRFIGIKQLDV